MLLLDSLVQLGSCSASSFGFNQAEVFPAVNDPAVLSLDHPVDNVLTIPNYRLNMFSVLEDPLSDAVHMMRFVEE